MFNIKGYVLSVFCANFKSTFVVKRHLYNKVTFFS